MARPLRVEFPGAIYHVTSRGNARKRAFLNDDDFEDFLEVLGGLIGRYGWCCHAYCLMGNHYHLLIETPRANLAAGMRQLNGIYTQRFNRRHRRVGPLFQGRYKAILVERDRYLLELCRYVVLNPVRARLCRQAGDYRRSSYAATAGTAAKPAWLTTDWVLSQFHTRRAKAQQAYVRFVVDGVNQDSPWNAVTGQVFLGEGPFVERMAARLRKVQQHPEIQRQQRYADRPGLDKLFTKSACLVPKQRNRLIRQAHLDHSYTLTAIGKTLGLHYSTISKILNKAD